MIQRRPSRSMIGIVFLAFLLMPGAVFAQVEVIYLGNEGFLLVAGEKKVLIDALFGDGLRGYGVVPPDVRRDAETAAGSFAGVDLILASHFHPDHFDPRAVLRHLEHNPSARFVSTEQAVAKLRALDGAAAVLDRVKALVPSPGEDSRFEHADIRLTALALHHGNDRDPPVQNLGLQIELGGLRLMHFGDTEVVAEDVQAHALGARRIDVGLIPYWSLLSPSYRAVVDLLDAEQTILMHLPTPDAPSAYFDGAGNYQGLLKKLRDLDPAAWIPLTVMESRPFGLEDPATEASAPVVLPGRGSRTGKNSIPSTNYSPSGKIRSSSSSSG